MSEVLLISLNKPINLMDDYIPPPIMNMNNFDENDWDLIDAIYDSPFHVDPDDYQIVPKPIKRRLLKDVPLVKIVNSPLSSLAILSEEEEIKILPLLEDDHDRSHCTDQTDCKHLDIFEHEETTEKICKDCGLITDNQRYDVEIEFGESRHWEFQSKNKFKRRYSEYINSFTGELCNKIVYDYTKSEAFEIIDALYALQTKKENEIVKSRKNKRSHKLTKKEYEVRLDWNDIQKTYKNLGYIKSTNLLWRSFAYQILGYDMPIIRKYIIAEVRIFDLWIRDHMPEIKEEMEKNNTRISKRGRPKKQTGPQPPLKYKDTIKEEDEKDDMDLTTIIYNLLFKDSEIQEQIDYEEAIKVEHSKPNECLTFFEANETKIRTSYLLYKKCQLDGVKNYENMPLKISKKMIEKYDKIWKIICDMNELEYQETKVQSFRIRPNMLKGKWSTEISDNIVYDTGNPIKQISYDTNYNIQVQEVYPDIISDEEDSDELAMRINGMLD